MLDFYEEKINGTKEQIKLAKLGFQEEMKSHIESLEKAESYEETELILNLIRKSRKAIASLEDELVLFEKFYENSKNSPENRKAEAINTLYGGRNNE